MEKIYSNNTKDRKLVKTKPETVQFLLNFSKSLEIVEAKGIKFESNKN